MPQTYQPRYLTSCKACGGRTSIKYAREHAGNCKLCTTGESSERRYSCPTCGRAGALSAYQKAHHYHCDACTRETDPEGYRREVMGYNDGGY